MTELTLVIPTFNRRAVLARTIQLLGAQEGLPAFEVDVDAYVSSYFRRHGCGVIVGLGR